MSLDPGMSREEKEKLLTQRMENMRKKNEELRKRHEEIEADKQNADKFSSTVTMEEVKPYVMKVPRVRPERAERQKEMSDPPPPRPADIMPARQRLSENDGPPPDPSYRFLSDPDRDGSEQAKENKRDFRGRGGRGRGRGKGGGREGHEDGDEAGKEEEVEQPENSSGVHGGRGRGRGRGRGGGFDNFNGERGFGRGRGRGRGRGNDRTFDNNAENGPDVMVGGGDNVGNGGSRGRFASRDIRYYNDEEGDSGAVRSGSGRGPGNYGQKHAFDDGDGSWRGRGRGRGNFDQRSRGRGRGRGHQREYERWKAEREAIDEARLSRSRTHGGGWRREWDNDKLDQGNIEETEPVYDPRYPRSKGEGFKLADYISTSEGDNKANSVPEVSGDHRPMRGRGSRGKYRGQGHFIDRDLNAQKHEEEIMAELDPDAVFGQRKIEGRGDSFTISVSNTTHSSGGENESEVLGKFVRVGSGRVGQNKRSPQSDSGGDEGIEGERQHYRGRGRGGRHLRGRGRGQSRGYFNNKENSPYKWVRPSGTTAQTSSQISRELDGPIPAVVSENISGDNALDADKENTENANKAAFTQEAETQQKDESITVHEETPEATVEDELEDYDDEVYEEATEEYYEDYQEAEEEEEKIEEIDSIAGGEANQEAGYHEQETQLIEKTDSSLADETKIRKEIGVNQEVKEKKEEEESNQEVNEKEEKEETNEVLENEEKEETNQEVLEKEEKGETNHEVLEKEEKEETNQEVLEKEEKEESNQEVLEKEEKEETNQEVLEKEKKEENNQKVKENEIKEETNQVKEEEKKETNMELKDKVDKEKTDQEVKEEEKEDNQGMEGKEENTETNQEVKENEGKAEINQEVKGKEEKEETSTSLEKDSASEAAEASAVETTSETNKEDSSADKEGKERESSRESKVIQKVEQSEKKDDDIQSGVSEEKSIDKEQPKEEMSEESEPNNERPSQLEVSKTCNTLDSSEKSTDTKGERKTNEGEKTAETLTKLTPSPTKTDSDKKPESRLTPLSSPAKTEEFVPNIEWK